MSQYRSRAPLRVSFSGGGTDVPPYCEEYGGQIFSTTIDKYVYITADFNDSQLICIYAFDLNQEISFQVGDYEYKGDEFDLMKAVLRHFQIQTGCDIYIHSDLPAGSGMGTSSSLVVALITLFSEFTQKHLSKYEIADLACIIERKELKHAGGYQDQYAAAFGGFNYMTFNTKVTVYPVEIPAHIQNELNYRLLLCYTGKTRMSADIQETILINYGKVNYFEGMRKLKLYTDQLRDLLTQPDTTKLDEFGKLMHEVWVAKQQVSDKISTDVVNKLYLNSLQYGAFGGKLLGAGGGGFLLLVIDPLKRMPLIQRLTQIGGEIVDFHFDTQGAVCWKSN